MARERPDALFFQGDGLTNQHGEQIVDFVTQNRIPNLFDQTGLTTAGASSRLGAPPSHSPRTLRCGSCAVYGPGE